MGSYIHNRASQVGKASASRGAYVSSQYSQVDKQIGYANDNELRRGTGSYGGRKKREAQFDNDNSQVGVQIAYGGSYIHNRASQVGKASASSGAYVSSQNSQVGSQVAYANDKDLRRGI